MNFEQATKAGSLYHLGMIAADDFEKILADDRYKPHWYWFHETYDNVCSVDLAGSVVAKTMGFEIHDTNIVRKLEQRKLIFVFDALLHLRRGDAEYAYILLRDGTSSNIVPYFTQGTKVPKPHFRHTLFQTRGMAKNFLSELRAFLPKLKEFEESVAFYQNQKRK